MYFSIPNICFSQLWKVYMLQPFGCFVVSSPIQSVNLQTWLNFFPSFPPSRLKQSGRYKGSTHPWPPYQPLKPIKPIYQGVRRLLHSRSMHAAIFNILHKVSMVACSGVATGGQRGHAPKKGGGKGWGERQSKNENIAPSPNLLGGSEDFSTPGPCMLLFAPSFTK